MKHLKTFENLNTDNIRYIFTQDNSSHWYMVPIKLIDRFKELNNIGDDESDNSICIEFGDYMTGGGIEDISFENPKKF